MATYSPAGGALPWRYQGRLLESAPGTPDLYDFTARSYSPSLGTFTQSDTYNGSASNTGLLNHYMYTGGNPVTMSDPSGHDFFGFNFDFNPVGFVGSVVGGAGDVGRAAVGWGWQQVSGFGAAAASTFTSAAVAIATPIINLGQSAVAEINTAWVSACTGVGSFARSASGWATDVRASINSTVESLSSIGSSINLSNIGAIALAMAADPHMALAMATMVPGLGEIAAAADMALYLYQGDFQNAALSASQFLPGGALLVLGGALGVGAVKLADKGISLMERANPLLRDAEAESKIMTGLARGGEDVAAIEKSVAADARTGPPIEPASARPSAVSGTRPIPIGPG